MINNKKISLKYFLVPLVLLLGACAGTEQRGLLISEVGTNRIELVLNEASNRRLTLGAGYTISLKNAAGVDKSVDLSAFGADMAGGSFLIIWEDGSYNGAPVAGDFSGGVSGNVPGIKVAASFLDGLRASPSELRLKGSHNRVSGLLAIFPLFTKDVIDDVVRFGLPITDRPGSGGRYTPASSPQDQLGNPSGSVHLQRRWNGTVGPIDTDHEADWILYGQSWGAPTP